MISRCRCELCVCVCVFVCVFPSVCCMRMFIMLKITVLITHYTKFNILIIYLYQ